jgi:hypothetical protein
MLYAEMAIGLGQYLAGALDELQSRQVQLPKKGIISHHDAYKEQSWEI